MVKRHGVVSMWVGTFADETALDEYVAVRDVDGQAECALWRDLGAEWLDEDLLEVAFHSGGVPVEDPVAGHAWSSSFADAVGDALGGLPLDDADTVVLLYDTAMDVPEQPKGPLRFLGTFDYSKD